MLALESARVKFEAEWDSEGAAQAPPKQYTEHRVKQELVTDHELPRSPVALPDMKPVRTVKQECSDAEYDSYNDTDSIYASSECSGEFLIDEILEETHRSKCKPCTVRIERDPVLELMCQVLRKQERSFSCDACGAHFKLEWYLIRHKRKCSKRIGKRLVNKKSEMTGTGSFVCVICHLQYKRRQDLEKHVRYCLYRMKQKSEEKLYICDICSKRYTVRYSFMMHIQKCSGLWDSSKSEVTKKLRYSCTACPKRLATKQLLRTHNRVHHTGERPYQCLVCGKSFNQGSNFKRHKVTHQFHAESSHACDYCGKHFAYKTDLGKHMVIHTKLRKFSCGTCGKKMDTRSHLNRHMWTHFPEKAKKTYPCDVCKKTFLERSNLLVHMRVHTGEKPYSCKVCSTRFSYLTSLLRHEVIHRNEVGPFPCSVCKKHLISRRRLINHVKYHIWDPNRPRKNRCVERLDCSVRIARLAHWESGIKVTSS